MFNLGALASTVLNSMDSAAKETIEDINKTVTIIASPGTYIYDVFELVSLHWWNQHMKQYNVCTYVVQLKFEYVSEVVRFE